LSHSPIVAVIKNKRLTLSYSLNAAYQIGGLHGAISLCHQAILQDPSCGDAYDFLGEFLCVQSKYEAAARAYARAVSVEPGRLCFQIKKDEVSQSFSGISHILEYHPHHSVRVACWIGDTPIRFFLGDVS